LALTNGNFIWKSSSFDALTNLVEKKQFLYLSIH